MEGQQNTVQVVRLVARNSIDEKIVAIAEKKQEFMQGLHKTKEGAMLLQTRMLCKLFDARLFKEASRKRRRDSGEEG